jgi:RNaseH domain of pPIWI_RE/pPIWI_RE module N-terminal domain/MID domain of pPIWI_RE
MTLVDNPTRLLHDDGGEATYTRKPTGRSGPLPLALTFDPDLNQPEHVITSVSWSGEAHSALQALRQTYRTAASRGTDLPTTALRARLEVADPDNLRLDRGLGLRNDPVILWTAAEPEQAVQRMSGAITGWLVDDVGPPEGGSGALARLRSLARSGALLMLSRRSARVFAWDHTTGNTAFPVPRMNSDGYADLADFVARRLEGLELFRELSPLRRIVSGDLKANEAGLITAPHVSVAEPFSLVVRVRVLTFASLPIPVVELEVAKRLWARSLAHASTRTLNAYAFPSDRQTAIQFTLERRAGQDGQGNRVWRYEPGNDFAPVMRAFGLPTGLTGDDIAAGILQVEHCPLYVVHKYGVVDRRASTLKYGVPDSDKRVVLRVITERLASDGFRPWTGLREIPTRLRSITDRHQQWRNHDNLDDVKQAQYRVWLKEAQASIAACYANAHDIVIGYHSTCRADAEKARDVLTEILGGRLTVELIRIGPATHGPRAQLPGADIRAPEERARVRSEAWRDFADGVRHYQRDRGRNVHGVLIIAPQYYDNFKGRDDEINKRAARLTLASTLGVPVQYLLPEQEDGEHFGPGQNPADLFEARIMAAWLDLAWKTLGRVRSARLAGELNKLYYESGVRPPDRILAVGILRRNETRRFGETTFVPYAIELDVTSGVCRARFARWRDGRLDITLMTPLPDTLVELARSGPLNLAPERGDRFKLLVDRSEAFFRQAITEFCQSSERPLVLIDADTCRRYWTWLADRNIDPSNIRVAGEAHVEADWGDASIVRVRTRNAPKVLFDQFYAVTTLSTGEVEAESHAHAADAKLFQLTESAIPVYLSFGSLIRSHQRLGDSCVEERLALKPTRSKRSVYVRELRPPRTDGWSSPSGVEFTIVRTAEGETSNQVVQVAAWLRTLFEHAGDWTIKPAPLYFERALAEYLSDFDTQEDETEGVEDAPDETS